MSGVKTIKPDLDRLDAHVDNLEDTLKPLLGDLEEMSSQLPLLDKAKLFSLTAYSIESLLFCSLKFSSSDTQSQAVLTELKRIQQYFGKIKAAENPDATEPEAQRSMTVNQEAAARILKADLSDNKDMRTKLAEKIAEERAKALLKSMETSNRKRPAEDSPQQSAGSGSEVQKKKRGGKDKSKKKNKAK